MPKNPRRSHLAAFLALFLAYPCSAGAASPGEALPEVESTYIANSFAPYNGAIIRTIKVSGLTFSSETAVRDLLGGREGKVFNSEEWTYGIRKLYNTNTLYDIQTIVRPAKGTSKREIEIELQIKDKWPILPLFYAQGGGGSNWVQVGLMDSNLGGYFTNASVSVGEFNGWYLYDINGFQEWLLDTEWMLGADLSRVGTPMQIQNPAGDLVQDLTWSRTQQQLLLGRRIGKMIRFFSYFELFEDGVLESAPSTTGIISQLQYRIRPVFIWGRSNLTNFLEEGFELSLAPAAANFLSNSISYEQIVASFKRTWIMGSKTNVAVNASAGVMSSVPDPYLFHLGGFDSVRGFSTFRSIGTEYANWSAEFRPYLFSLNLPIAERSIAQGCLFQDGGWIHGPYGSLGMLSAGVGIRAIFPKFAGALIRIDFAQTIAPAEGYGFSFGIGQFF